MSRSPVIDLHCDSLYEHVQGRMDLAVRNDHGHLDLPRMRKGKLDAEVFAIWTNPDKYRPGARLRFALRAIRQFKDVCRLLPDTVALARSPGELEAIVSSGRIAGILGIEGGHALEGDIANLDRLHRHGVQLLTLTWNNSNQFARSCLARDGHRVGLTRLGRALVHRMNRLGMLIDLSHSSDRTFDEALDFSTAPVVCSHSGCRALRRFPRNLTDVQLRELGRAGGVVGIVFLPYFLRRDFRRASLEDVLDHVEHAVSVAGIYAVALGSDFDGFGDPPPRGLEDVTRLPALADGLRRRGFTDADARKVLGLNFLRAWR
ncbi:dipeptidase, partial [candidate division WOR-3 bacterium]|nr:dipeptidase [candidate division WOR-3 bacterium]